VWYNHIKVTHWKLNAFSASTLKYIHIYTHTHTIETVGTAFNIYIYPSYNNIPILSLQNWQIHLVHPLWNIYIHIHIHTPLKPLEPPLIYTFTPVITTYQFYPYKINKHYVVSEYINNISAVRNLILLSTTLKFSSYPTSQHPPPEDHLHFVMLFKMCEILITNFINPSNPICNAHYI